MAGRFDDKATKSDAEMKGAEAGGTVQGELLRPLLKDAVRPSKTTGAEQIMRANYFAEQYGKSLTAYVRRVNMPKRRWPTPLF